MPKQTKDPEELDMSHDQSVDVKDQTIASLQEENQAIRGNYNMLMDRINRLESVQNQNRLRKYDEVNDPESRKKTGRIPSMDGKDPIVSLKRTGKCWMNEHNQVFDEQAITVVTLGGVTKTTSLLEFAASCSGNSILCVVNDWEELMAKQSTLAKKYHEFQRMTGRTAKVNTVELLKEIKELEKGITVNVTLSEDYGKTYEGKTLDVPFQDVFNAIS